MIASVVDLVSPADFRKPIVRCCRVVERSTPKDREIMFARDSLEPQLKGGPVMFPLHRNNRMPRRREIAFENRDNRVNVGDQSVGFLLQSQRGFPRLSDRESV